MREELKHKDRADYGKKIVEKLTVDLRMERRLLFEIIQFSKVYPIVHTLRAQLSWSHYGSLIRIKKKEYREFYELQTIRNMWSTRELEKQIKSNLYERMCKEGKIIVSQPTVPALPEKVFKDTYNFDFMQLGNDYTEKTVEDELIGNVEALLLEFGQDFSLAGRQRKIVIDDQSYLNLTT